MPESTRKSFASLEALCSGEGNDRCVVLLHGYGADAANLFPISETESKRKWDWIFLEAPLIVDLGYGMQGRAWFPIDMLALEQAIQSKSFREFHKEHMEGYEKARQALSEALEEIPYSMDQVAIGGFSQGAMLATDYVLTQNNRPHSLTVFSGNYVDEAGWEHPQANMENLRIFQSHGRADPLLSFKRAQHLHNLFEKLGANAQFHEFPGEHEIPPRILQKWKSLILLD